MEKRSFLARTMLLGSSAEAVLNSLPHPVIVIGPNGEICDANAAAEQFFELLLQPDDVEQRTPRFHFNE